MKKLPLLAFVSSLACAQTLVTISDTLYSPVDGTLWTGVIDVAPATACKMKNGSITYGLFKRRYCLGAGSNRQGCSVQSAPGIISLQLLPTTSGSGTTPANCFFQAAYTPDSGGGAYSEQWVVAPGGPYKIADIRTNTTSPINLPVGPQGPAGIQGIQGVIGNTGPTGGNGPANTLSVGTVSTLSPGASATASVTGSAPSQTLNLGIPSGLTGPTGSTGTSGSSGPPGPAPSGSGFVHVTSGVLDTPSATIPYTSITGLGTAATQATGAFAPATSGTPVLKGNGSGGFSTAAYNDITAMFNNAGACTAGYLTWDGKCTTPPGGLTAPSVVSVIVSDGSGGIRVGTAADVLLLGALGNAITGNAATASAFFAAPSQCSSGSAPQGIAANGNIQNCTAYDTSGMAAAVQSLSLLKTDNLSSLANKATSRTNLGISTVGNTGAYSDLTGRPFVPTIAVTPGLIAGDNGGNARVALYGDVVALWSSCTSGFLAFNGTCTTPGGGPPAGTGYVTVTSGSFGTPSASIPYSALSSVPTATSSVSGILTSTDWITFNGKQAALGYTPLNPANNLSEVTATTARTNLGLNTPSNYPTLNQSTTGNAATASSLFASPSVCGAGFVPAGISSNGNAFGCAPVQSNGYTVFAATSTRLIVAFPCATAQNCNVSFASGITQPYSSSANFDISSGSGTVYVWLESGPVIKVGIPASGMAGTCTGCTVVTATSIPITGAIPIWSWHATSGAWDLNGTDLRPALGIGGITATAQLSDLTMALSSTTVTVGGNCASLLPCRIKFGDNVVAFTASATLTAPTGTGTAYVWATSGGGIVAGLPASGFSATCTGCTTTTATSFPVGVYPLGTWSATSGVWNSTGYADNRAQMSVDKPFQLTGPCGTFTETTTLRQIDTTGCGGGFGTKLYSAFTAWTAPSGTNIWPAGTLQVSACAGIACLCTVTANEGAGTNQVFLTITYTDANQTNPTTGGGATQLNTAGAANSAASTTLLINSKAATNPSYTVTSFGGGSGNSTVNVVCTQAQ